MIHYNVAGISLSNDKLKVAFCNINGQCILKSFQRKKIHQNDKA